MKTTHLLITVLALGALLTGCSKGKKHPKGHRGTGSTAPGTTPGGGTNGSLQLSAIAPGSGDVGTFVVLSGTGFLANPTVEFNAVAATNVQLVSPTTISCLAPANALGLVDVEVINTDGTRSKLNNAFTYATGGGNNGGLLARVGNYGNPSAAEQELLELTNRARRDPVAEGNRVGINFSAYPARPPLAYNGDLAAAARAHSLDMVNRGFYGHLNPDNVNANGRLLATNYDLSGYYGTGTTFNLSENIGVGSGNRFQTAQDVHDTFIIDAGLTLPKHREIMLGFGGHFPRTREVGMGFLTGQTSSGQPWTAFVTQEFAFNKDEKPFITGVVYSDSNGNQIANGSEGQGGVNVVLSHASGFSINVNTADAGGYSFEVLVPGQYTITINGQSTTVTVGTDSVKVDARNGSIVTY